MNLQRTKILLLIIFVTISIFNVQGRSLDSSLVANFVFENPCLGESVVFTDLSQGEITSWNWDFGDGFGTSVDQDPEYIFPGANTYIVQLIIGNDCEMDTVTKEIVLTIKPPILVDTVICNNEPITFNGITYQEMVFSSGVFNYTSTFTDIQGCDSIINLRVTVNACGCELTFPNVFTPDGDGINDIFQPVVVCDQSIQDYRMVIYDRWGETVYETFEYQDFWDGTINGFPMPMDVFVYLVEYEIVDGENRMAFKETSDVTLIR